jgi:DNA-binding MarR family transcriptional regulator
MSNAPFGFEKPEDSPGFLLWQTTMTWQRLIKKALEPFEISHAQFVVMALLLWFEKQGYDTTQIEIAQWSKLDKMTVSKSLKKLATDRLLSRAEHTRDTRAKSVTLTAKGKALIRKLVPLVEQVDEQFFSIVSMREQQAFMQVLTQLVGDTHGG